MNLVTNHGRATPLLWLTVLKDELKDKRNDYEDLCLARLAEVLPEGVAVTILADRGFGDTKLFAYLETLGFAYVIRFRGNIHVTAADVHSSDRVRPVSLLPERKRQFAQPSLDPVRLDVLEVLTVHARRALVGAALGIGVCQNVLAADLVVEGVEAVAGFCLRFRVQRRLQFLNAVRS